MVFTAQQIQLLYQHESPFKTLFLKLQKFSEIWSGCSESRRELRDSLSFSPHNNKTSQYWACYVIPKQNISIILETLICILFLLDDILQFHGDSSDSIDMFLGTSNCLHEKQVTLIVIR
jgi:hypothetical protein